QRLRADRLPVLEIGHAAGSAAVAGRNEGLRADRAEQAAIREVAGDDAGDLVAEPGTEARDRDRDRIGARMVDVDHRALRAALGAGGRRRRLRVHHRRRRREAGGHAGKEITPVEAARPETVAHTSISLSGSRYNGLNRNVKLCVWPSRLWGSGRLAHCGLITARTARSAKARNTGSPILPVSAGATLATRATPPSSVRTVSSTCIWSTPFAPAS